MLIPIHFRLPLHCSDSVPYASPIVILRNTQSSRLFLPLHLYLKVTVMILKLSRTLLLSFFCSHPLALTLLLSPSCSHPLSLSLSQFSLSPSLTYISPSLTILLSHPLSPSPLTISLYPHLYLKLAIIIWKPTYSSFDVYCTRHQTQMWNHITIQPWTFLPSAWQNLDRLLHR